MMRLQQHRMERVKRQLVSTGYFLLLYISSSSSFLERKRRATSPTTFGEALLDLLGNEDEKKSQKGQSTILSLAPHIRRSAQSSRLNEKASRLAIEAKRKRADRARVIDVIGGWGPPGQPPKTADGSEKGELNEEESDDIREWRLQGGAQGYEKKLRKVAQRGVVKLFNAIRAAQNTTESDLEQGNGQKNGKAAIPKAAKGDSLKGDNALGSKGRAGELVILDTQAVYADTFAILQ